MPFTPSSEPDWFAELAEFLRIPSVSADAAHAGDVRRAGEWVCEFVRAAGGHADLLDWNGQPLAVGELRASERPEHAPTILCYGHFDVQPPGPISQWESAPFEPEIRGEHLYGRGVVDDKAPLYMLLCAGRALAREHRLPVNVRFVCDGEEETGGQSIVEFLESDTRGADAAIIFDSTMSRRGAPEFTVATRGLAFFHVTVRTGASDLHSGLHGGAALNAAHALMRTLDGVLAVDGRVPEPLREGIRSLSDEEVAAWQDLPAGAAELEAQGGRPADPRAVDEFYLRTTGEPAVDVNGIATGSPTELKTVLPVEAVANVSIRLAGGQDVARVVATFTEMLLAAAPPGADVDVRLMASADPAVVPVDSRALKLGRDGFERVFGVRPALKGIGGSLPVLAVLTKLGIPTIFSGFTLPDSNVHAPNERLPAEYVSLGTAAAGAMLEELGAL